MATINYCQHIRWDGDRCYVKCYCRDLTPGEHYVIYPMYGGSAKATWGFGPPGTTYVVTSYIVGSKINYGGCNITFRLCVDGDPDDYVAATMIYIPPKAKPTCVQPFYIKNRISGKSLGGALCHITSGLWCVTSSTGRCNITLNSGDSYTVKISKDKYTTLSKSFSASTSTVSLSLTPVKCNQNFTVKDTAGSAISSAKVTIGSTVKYTTTFGSCSFSLYHGIPYSASASKSGYVCHSCSRSFTACTSTITLTLKKPTANITFSSVPEHGVAVTVGGTVIGNT